MGKSGESVNTTHQTKKLDVDDLMYYRDRFDVPLTDEQVRNIEYFRPDEKSQEIKYLKERRIKLGGFLPERSTFAKPIKAPSKDGHKWDLYESQRTPLRGHFQCAYHR